MMASPFETSDQPCSSENQTLQPTNILSLPNELFDPICEEYTMDLIQNEGLYAESSPNFQQHIRNFHEQTKVLKLISQASYHRAKTLHHPLPSLFVSWPHKWARESGYEWKFITSRTVLNWSEKSKAILESPTTPPDQIFQVMVETSKLPSDLSCQHTIPQLVKNVLQNVTGIEKIPHLKIVIIYRDPCGWDFDNRAGWYRVLSYEMASHADWAAKFTHSYPVWRKMEFEVRGQGKVKKWGMVRDDVSKEGEWKADESTDVKIEEEDLRYWRKIRETMTL